MKRIRTLRPAFKPLLLHPSNAAAAPPRIAALRCSSTITTTTTTTDTTGTTTTTAGSSPSTSSTPPPTVLPTLPPSRDPLRSAKLPALHARLNLYPTYPLQTLARALIDPTADANQNFNNTHLSVLGNSLTGYFAAEYLMVTYPRLPTEVLYAAVGAYVGNKALASLGREWGVEAAFEPTAEVDPGLLQFRRVPPGKTPVFSSSDRGGGNNSSTLEHATANLVRAVLAGVYLHEGLPACKQFFRQHVLARKLEVEKLFDFRQPTRELSRLCAREGFDPPVARLLAETGRMSRHPVFVVGVYSDRELMGEGHGGSLDEARIRAAANALKGWYLYSPLDKDLPSKTEEREGVEFKPAYIDPGEVIV